jgi:hypothetical protein
MTTAATMLWACCQTSCCPAGTGPAAACWPAMNWAGCLSNCCGRGPPPPVQGSASAGALQEAIAGNLGEYCVQQNCTMWDNPHAAE